MKLIRNLPNGTPVSLVCQEATQQRLFPKHFKDRPRSLASHFKRWRSVREILKQDLQVFRNLLDDVSRAYEETGEGVYSVTIEHPDQIGWETSAPITAFRLDELEHFTLNRAASGLRLKRTATHYKAPLTHFVTIVYEIMHDRERANGLFVLIHDLYPGIDLGELVGNITTRERRVFYCIDHPGE